MRAAMPLGGADRPRGVRGDGGAGGVEVGRPARGDGARRDVCGAPALRTVSVGAPGGGGGGSPVSE